MTGVTTVPFLELLSVYHANKDEYDDAYHRVMNSGRWILGTECEAFESEFGQYIGAKHAIGVGNGLEALVLVLQGLGIGKGDRVLVPAHTFIATWLAVRSVGAIPVPVEPEPGHFMPSSKEYLAAIDSGIAAIVVVHLYGEMRDLVDLKSYCDDHGVKLIEDAAQSHGAKAAGYQAGQLGGAAGFSFYPGKNLGAFGDAGAVTTNDDELAGRIRSLRNYGSSRRYIHDLPGSNSRLDELQAAFLRVRLRHLDRHNDVRRCIAQHYLKALAGIPFLELPPSCNQAAHVWHLFVVRTPFRDALQSHLLHQGVQTLVHYPVPCYRAAPFAGCVNDEATLTDGLCDRVLSLPIGPHLSTDQVDHVVQALHSFNPEKAQETVLSSS